MVSYDSVISRRRDQANDQVRLDGLNDSLMALVLVGRAGSLDRSSSMNNLLRSGFDR